MPGYKVSRFPNLSANEKSDYTCSICEDILNCPMTTPCCLQTFCEDCITIWLQNNTTCPYDRKTLTVDRLSRASSVLVNMLENLNINCEFWDNGCREVIKLEDLIQHTAICEHNEAKRPKTCDVCYCYKTRDHDCVKALLVAKCSANIEIDFLRKTVTNMESEKDQFLKTIQQISNDNGDEMLGQIKQLRINNEKLRVLIMSGLLYDDDAKMKLLKLLLSMVIDENCKNKDDVLDILNELAHNKYVRQISRDFNTIVKLLSVIDKTILINTCNTVLVKIWKIFFSFTDENASNSCEQFMENSGMARFIKCIDLFPDDKDLLFFIFGTLSNVSECDLVNGKLIAKDYIQRMVKHLNQQAYGYTICGFVADILTNIAAINTTQWSEDLPGECKRDFVLGKIKTEISTWKINFDLCFQFNALAPLIKLLKPNIPADCYILPVWRLANCTRVESSQYCPMLEREGGLQVLVDLIKRSDVTRDIKMLAALTLYQCELAKTDRAASDKLKTSESTQVSAEFLRRKQMII